jgi:hypothetical protein
MKSHEFTINIPINIKINGDGEPEISAPAPAPEDDSEHHQNPVMVSPLQQELELAKAAQGKQSPVIDKITADNNIGEEPAPNPDELKRLLQLVGR